MKKTLLFLVGLLVIATSVYILNNSDKSQQNNFPGNDQTNNINTTGWQEYKNSKYQYSFKYAESMKVESSTEAGGPAPVSPESDIVNVGSKDSPEYIFGVGNSHLKSLSLEEIKKEAGNVNGINQIQIAGFPGYKVDRKGDGVISDFYYIQKPGQSVLRLVILKNSDLAQALLSTFEYTR